MSSSSRLRALRLPKRYWIVASAVLVLCVAVALIVHAVQPASAPQLVNASSGSASSQADSSSGLGPSGGSSSGNQAQPVAPLIGGSGSGSAAPSKPPAIVTKSRKPQPLPTMAPLPVVIVKPQPTRAPDAPGSGGNGNNSQAPIDSDVNIIDGSNRQRSSTSALLASQTATSTRSAPSTTAAAPTPTPTSDNSNSCQYSFQCPETSCCVQGQCLPFSSDLSHQCTPFAPSQLPANSAVPAPQCDTPPNCVPIPPVLLGDIERADAAKYNKTAVAPVAASNLTQDVCSSAGVCDTRVVSCQTCQQGCSACRAPISRCAKRGQLSIVLFDSPSPITGRILQDLADVQAPASFMVAGYKLLRPSPLLPASAALFSAVSQSNGMLTIGSNGFLGAGAAQSYADGPAYRSNQTNLRLDTLYTEYIAARAMQTNQSSATPLLTYPRLMVPPLFKSQAYLDTPQVDTLVIQPGVVFPLVSTPPPPRGNVTTTQQQVALAVVRDIDRQMRETGSVIVGIRDGTVWASVIRDIVAMVRGHNGSVVGIEECLGAKAYRSHPSN
ncbi:hypothetical protein RI367_001052 [Sorochytrium milnesiophthora]